MGQQFDRLGNVEGARMDAAATLAGDSARDDAGSSRTMLDREAGVDIPGFARWGSQRGEEHHDVCGNLDHRARGVCDRPNDRNVMVCYHCCYAMHEECAKREGCHIE